MDSFELNKIAAAVLLLLLIVIGIGKISDGVFKEAPLEANAYPIEVEVAAVSGPATAEVVEEGPSLAELLSVASVDKGQSVFKKCKACHTLDNGGKNGTGPNLWNGVGRAKGQVAGFKYSNALLEKGGDWTYENLDAFLKKPKDYVPGTKMAFAGLKKATDRAAVIAYMRTYADAPLDLPVVEAAPVEEVVEEAVTESEGIVEEAVTDSEL